MAACDVLVNLRYPTMGETSGSVIRALSLGKPLVVSDVGWFRELPDDVVLKVPVDEYEVDDARGGARRRRRPRRAARRGRARVRRARARRSSASPTPTSSALEVAAGGDAVDDAVLLADRRGGGRGRASTTRPRWRGPPARRASSRERVGPRARRRAAGVGVARGDRRPLDRSSGSCSPGAWSRRGSWSTSSSTPSSRSRPPRTARS